MDLIFVLPVLQNVVNISNDLYLSSYTTNGLTNLTWNKIIRQFHKPQVPLYITFRSTLTFYSLLVT